MTDWIGEIFTSTTGWDHLQTLVDLDTRMAGSEGERRAAEATRDALSAVGADNTRLDEFDVQGWTREDSTIEVGSTEQPTIALPRSPADSVTGELIDLGHGLPADFDQELQGKIVMVASDVPDWYDRFLHRREKYYHAVDAGAAGFIFRNHVEGCLPPTGSVGTAESPIGEIPAVGVSKEVGARLSRRFDGEQATVTVSAAIEAATSQNVHATLGPETEAEILLTSHVDAHDISEGAGDNGAGTAVVLEVANALATRESELDTRVHCIAYGAEEVGLCGSEYDSNQRDTGSIKAIVNNDGVARGRTLDLVAHGFDELIDVAETVADRFDHPIETTPELGPHSDHWPYVQWGVPGYHVMSETDGAGRGWGHTHADTIDKLESRTLREQSVLLAELVVQLADDRTRIDHRSPRSVASQLRDENLAEGMQITGDWPYDESAH